MYKFIGKKGQSYELDIKLNANCPNNEKVGTGTGSCSGGNQEKLKIAVLPPYTVSNDKYKTEYRITVVDGNDQNKIIGGIEYMVFHQQTGGFQPGDTRISLMTVDEKYKRKGIGSLLLKKIPSEHAKNLIGEIGSEDGYHFMKAHNIKIFEAGGKGKVRYVNDDDYEKNKGKKLFGTR